MAVRITDLADMIEARRRVYQSAMQADMARLTRTHGEDAVREALELIRHRDGQHQGDQWNERVHAQAVARGLERAIAEHRARGPTSFISGSSAAGRIDTEDSEPA